MKGNPYFLYDDKRSCSPERDVFDFTEVARTFLFGNVEAEMHDISVLYDVFLAFDSHFSRFFYGVFGSVVEVILVFDHFCPYEALFEIGVNNSFI